MDGDKSTNNSIIKFIQIFDDDARSYQNKVQKKTFEFIKYDLALFSIISWLFSESFEKFTGFIIGGLFLIGFFSKIILISTQFKEFFIDDNDFWNFGEKCGYDRQKMKNRFYATKFETYRKTIKHYKPKMIYVNFSITISFFSILLILIAKLVNEFEKAKYGEEIYTSKIDIVIGIFTGIGLIFILLLFLLGNREKKENSQQSKKKDSEPKMQDENKKSDKENGRKIKKIK